MNRITKDSFGVFCLCEVRVVNHMTDYYVFDFFSSPFFGSSFLRRLSLNDLYLHTKDVIK